MITVLVYVVAVLFAAMGLYALAVPRGLLGTFGVAAETVDSRNEVRAVYGGFGLAVAAVLVYGASQPTALGRGLMAAVGVAVAGMAVGRLVGIAVERPRRLYPVWVFLASEIAMAAILLVAARGA